MDIQLLINRIIPPSDYFHRNGFSNSYIIDRLDGFEKKLVEEALINKLLNKNKDILIVETLAYLKSENALPIFYELMSKSNDELSKLIIATSIFEINRDNKMIDIAISCVKKIDNIKDAYYIYKLISTFYFLEKFKNYKINNLINEYTIHKEYLVSYNAKKALGM